MEECGFALAGSVVHDLAKLSYTTRRRWLAVYINTLRIEEWPCLGRLFPALCYDEATYDPQLHCAQMLTAIQRTALQITPHEFSLLNDQDVLPSWQRNHALAKKDALALRTCSRGSVFPVVNASYRTATAFSREYLGGKGLMSWLLRDNRNQVRWLGKWEAARALAFPSSAVLPSDESVAFHALGNAISPLHAAFAVHHCSEVMKHQTGRSYLTAFSQVVRQIKEERADLVKQYPSMFSTAHEQLQLPGPVFQLCQLCPFCGRMTQFPLIVACSQCGLVACRDCFAETCSPSHQASRGPLEPSQQELEQLQGAQFTVRHLFHGDPVPLATCAFQDMRQVRSALSLPDTAVFFLNCDAVDDAYRPRHNDAFSYAELRADHAVCPMCGEDVFALGVRFCPKCKRLGCSSCVADSCNRCAKGQLICRECHMQILQRMQNASHEEAALQLEDQANAASADFAWAVHCPLQNQASMLTVILYPDVVAYAPTHVYADRQKLLHLVSCVPSCTAKVPQRPVFFRGVQRKPVPQQASDAYVLIVPEEGRPVH